MAVIDCYPRNVSSPRWDSADGWFRLPLSKALGIKEALKCGPDVGFFGQLFTTRCDTSIATLGWMYTLFFVFLGLAAAGFAALHSLFNIAGRFFCANLSDKLGRKMTYTLLFVLGGILYFSVPASAGAANKLMFIGAFCIILSMYGGSFSTVPTDFVDLLGTQFVASKLFMTSAELAEGKRLAHDRAKASEAGSTHAVYHAIRRLTAALAWGAVGLPLAWGAYRTMLSAVQFFN